MSLMKILFLIGSFNAVNITNIYIYIYIYSYNNHDDNRMINLKDHPKYFLIFEKTSSTGSAILSHPQGETLITCERMNSICNETNLILQKSA